MDSRQNRTNLRGVDTVVQFRFYDGRHEILHKNCVVLLLKMYKKKLWFYITNAYNVKRSFVLGYILDAGHNIDIYLIVSYDIIYVL